MTKIFSFDEDDAPLKESRREQKIKHHLFDKRGNKSRTSKTTHRVSKPEWS